VKNTEILKYNAMKEMRQKKFEKEENYEVELISALYELREENNSSIKN
jgi:hypothetical protein